MSETDVSATPTQLPDGLAAGVQHLDLMAGKCERLRLTTEAAYDQVLTEIRRSELTPTMMLELWEWARSLPTRASSTRMADALDLSTTELALWARCGTPDDFRKRSGEFPPSWLSLPRPGRMQCVYLLQGANRQVLYVGMSQNVRARMKAHRKGPHGEEFKFWEIIPCQTREEAHGLEGDLIFQHQPAFNVADRRRRRVPKQGGQA